MFTFRTIVQKVHQNRSLNNYVYTEILRHSPSVDIILFPQREIWYNGRMRNIIQGPQVTWIDIKDPEEADITYLQETYALHPLVVDELLPRAWRTKVEVFPDYLFFVYYYPVYSKVHRHTRPAELDIIIGKNLLVTNHYNSIVPLKALFDQCNLYEDKKKTFMGQTAGHLLFHVLGQLQEGSFVKLDRINKKLHHIEDQIFKGNERQMLQEISYLKADIINFWRIVNPQGEIFESLHSQSYSFFGTELKPYFTRLLGEWDQERNDLETYKETIEALEQTNNGLLADKTNEIVKILTLFSVVFLPPVLMASLFSMNASDIPLMEIRGGFWILVGLMTFGVLGMLWYFRHKRWL